jgi:hypothetical protein
MIKVVKVFKWDEKILGTNTNKEIASGAEIYGCRKDTIYHKFVEVGTCTLRCRRYDALIG